MIFAARILSALFLVALPIQLSAQQLSSAEPAQIGSSLTAIYQSWLDEDVRYIITADEKAEFLRLTTDKQRDDFVIAFWSRRDPTPGTPTNEFKQEHYRRIAYSNEHFAGKERGALTDRGRIYIQKGPPDEIVSKVGSGHVPSMQIWRYMNFRQTGSAVVFTFVDECECGDFRLRHMDIN